MISKKLYSVVGLLILHFSATAMNLLRPWDTLLRPEYDHTRRVQTMAFLEGDLNAKGYNEDGDRVNVMRIWNNNQDALAMLKGFPATSDIGQLLTQLSATDDGVRGHFDVCGSLSVSPTAAFGVRCFFLNDWSIDFYLPVMKMSLKNVTWTDKTKNVNAQDARVKQLLTDNLFEHVAQLGDCLQLQDWTRSGVGDLTLMVQWFRDFPQPKPLLKNVRVNWRLGVNCPTGKRADEDLVLALPFGNDGSFGLPFGLGLDLSLGYHAKVGVDVELLQIFGNVRNRRVKTSKDQTELLLLKKCETHKDFGLTQRFNLYTQMFHLFGGFSLKLGYQFVKHGDDVLSVRTNDVANEVVNTAISLQEWTAHYGIVNANYALTYRQGQESYNRPQVGLYVRIPFNGQLAVLSTGIGAMIAVDF